MSTATTAAAAQREATAAHRDLMHVSYAIALASINGTPLSARARARFAAAQERFDRASAEIGDAA